MEPKGNITAFLDLRVQKAVFTLEQMGTSEKQMGTSEKRSCSLGAQRHAEFATFCGDL